MSARSKLFTVRKPYDLLQSEDAFLKAMRENCRYQFEQCPPYRAILDDRGFSPDLLREPGDLAKLPVLPTLFFKSHALASMPRRRMLIKATSSGTGGKRTRIGFDAHGLYCGLRMVLRLGKFYRLFSLQPVHYIVLGYQPHRGNQTAVTKTAFGATLFAPALHREYALKYQRNGYQVDLDGLIQALQKHESSRFPVRMMGFPSYTYFLLRRMEEQGVFLTLKKGSKILLGGGWKQFYTQQVDKQVLYDLAQRVLGIGEEDITEFFGAVEHPILYCDCARHHFHVPAYSRVIVRDVHTLEPVENGTVGLVNLLTPMVYSAPILSVMTDDLGVLHDGEECGCGIPSPYLELIGRVGLRDIKTCAAGAADLLKNLKV